MNFFKRKKNQLKISKRNYSNLIYSLYFILLFLCEISLQKKSINDYDTIQKTSEFSNFDTDIKSANNNNNNNFCVSPCSCLGDYFECKRVNLTKVPKIPGWVRNLELTGNRLDDGVEFAIGNLTELLTLNLRKNRLHRIPVFKGLIALQKLNLAHNKIQVITIEALLSLPNLHDLDLSKNLIKTILPLSFPTRNSLNSLNLNYNRINSLEDNAFNSLTKLTELHLSHNNITTLSNGIFKSLQALKRLDLNNNHIDISWSVFKGLNELKILKLRSNGIKSLPDGVFHALKSITVLELDSNRITFLNRQGFYNLTSLQTLSLSNNSVDRIEVDTWEFTQYLISLDLSYNNLTEIRSQHLDFLNNLKILNLRNNRIQHISDNTFDSTKLLEQLDLSSNKLSWMIEDTSGIFKSLKYLKKLDLNHNDVKSINQKAFIGLDNLKYLNLKYNNLTSIQFNAFESLKNLEEIHLNSEYILCDCNIQWFHSWLKANSNKISKDVSVICDYPIHLRGKLLETLKDDDFMCNESPKPQLIKEPTNQLAIKGTNVVLECSAISSLPSEMHIQWKHDNFDIHDSEIETKPIKTNNNSTMLSSFLHLRNVNREHTGKYQCIVTNSFGTVYSQKFKITVATFPGFKKVPSNVTLNSGSTARLDCSAYGEPTPQIAWQKDGGDDFPAARERRMHVMPTDDAFFIINAKTSDMGVYTCTAENPAGINRVNATLIVYEPPAFVKSMESKEITQGTSTVLECMSSGSPKPILNWYKDDKPLKLTERHFFAAESQLLIIVDAKLSDAGIYKCEMKNELGGVSGNLTLKINKAISNNVINVEEMTGIVIITVFCCAVGTSVIWVVIIYQTKKGNNYNANNFNNNVNNSNGNNNLNGVSLLNQVTSSNNIVDNYIQATASGAAISLNDESVHHLIVENSNNGNNSLQPSQILIMSHLNHNNNDNNTRNDLRCNNSISSINNNNNKATSIVPTSIPCIIDNDSDKLLSIIQDADTVTNAVSILNMDSTKTMQLINNGKSKNDNKNLLSNSNENSNISTKTVSNYPSPQMYSSINNSNNSSCSNNDDNNKTLSSSSLYKNSNDNHIDSSSISCIENQSKNYLHDNCTNNNNCNSNNSRTSSNNNTSSNCSRSNSTSSNKSSKCNSENDINQLSIPLLTKDNENNLNNGKFTNNSIPISSSTIVNASQQDINIESIVPILHNTHDNDSNTNNFIHDLLKTDGKN